MPYVEYECHPAMRSAAPVLPAPSSQSAAMSTHLLLALLLALQVAAVLSSLTNNTGGIVHIALAIDDHSLKDMLIVMKSALISAIEPNDIMFHIASCGRDSKSALSLQSSINRAIKGCLSNVKFEVSPFTLPPISGFAKQLDMSSAAGSSSGKKGGKSHWYSPSGTDMARFFMASTFSTVDRLLYIDNDIIITCCLEEIYHSELDEGTAVGIALDDLKWATVTQFQRHYNSSHPLVVKNIRRRIRSSSSGGGGDVISEQEFKEALPKYPNDGVILIDVRKYNDMKIMQCLDELALHNSRGEYVVGVGSQQFTTLCLFDRWTELTPRANLRHTPDIARGFLMWFYYSGFIHYAGIAKPRSLCQWGDAGNEHRTQTYLPWANAVAQLYSQCQHVKVVHAESCARHVPTPVTAAQLMHFIAKFASHFKDSSNVVVHLGPLDAVRQGLSFPLIAAAAVVASAPSAAAAEENTDDAALLPGRHQVMQHHRKSLHKPNRKSYSKGNSSAHAPVDFVSGEIRATDTLYLLHQAVFFNSSWSVAVFDKDADRLYGSTLKVIHALPSAAKSVDRRPKSVLLGPSASKRRVSLHAADVCDGTQDRRGAAPARKGSSLFKIRTSWNATVPNTNPVFPAHCASVLQELEGTRDAKYKHWSVIGITIDYNMLSVEILTRLDLTFMRPRFVLVRIAAPLSLRGTANSAAAQAMAAHATLTRAGMVAVIDSGGSCNDRHREGGGGASDYACVWGTRITTFDIPSLA